MLMDLLERLKSETGTTIVMVSHDINLAAMYSDQMVLLAGGRVVKEGSPATVLDASVLEQIFGCPFLVDLNPLGNLPRIFPIPGRFRS
jgi:iron complex transport system ATP-binding protein